MNEMLDFWVNNGYVIRKMEFDGLGNSCCATGWAHLQ